MLRSNFHTHTTFCDGKDSPEAMVRAALDLGFTHLGFSGNMDSSIFVDMKSYSAEIERLKEQYKDRIDIIKGIELDVLIEPKEAEGAEYIIGSTHFVGLPADAPLPVDDTYEMLSTLCREYFSGDYYALAKAYYQLESTVYDKLHCTFIGHFDLVSRFNDTEHYLDEKDPRYLTAALETMEYLVSKDVPFEINCGAVNRGRKKELYPNSSLLRSLKEMGGEIIINSDAHSASLLNGGFELAVETAIACGFTHTNILEHDERGNVVFRQIPLDLCR